MSSGGIQSIMEWWGKALLCIAAYLTGSINFAIIFSGLKGTDITKKGSGNPGTMNVLRSVGKLWGVLTFVCDCAKGVIFAVIGMYWIGSADWLFILGLITVLGHVFPIYSKFKGGKGVATSIGVFIVAYPVVGAVVLAVLIIMLLFVKYGFIGSVTCITAITIYSCVVGRDNVAVLVCSLIIWLIVLLRHYSNIKRFIKGEENTLKLVGKNQSKDLTDEAKDDESENSDRRKENEQ